MAEEESIRSNKTASSSDPASKKATSSPAKRPTAASAVPAATKVPRPKSVPGPTAAPKCTVTRPPPPTQKPPSLQRVAAASMVEGEKSTSNRTNKPQKSMGGTPVSATKQPSTTPRAGLEAPSSTSKASSTAKPVAPKPISKEAKVSGTPRASAVISGDLEKTSSIKDKQQSKKEVDGGQQDHPSGYPHRKQQQTQTNKGFSRQRSFVLSVPENEKKSSSPRFKRSRTQSCMLPPSPSTVANAARKRNSHSISEQQNQAGLNPQAKEFVMKRDLPGMSPEVSNCFSDQEKVVLYDALQPVVETVTRSKVKSLIEGADVILKAVLRGSLTNSGASQVISKMVEIDTTETFIESLMNSCQEHHGTLMSKAGKSPTGRETTAFLTFLCDLYQQLKGRHYWTVTHGNPTHLLLSLLSDWCQQILQEMSQGNTQSFHEVDRLTKMFTLVGRDMVGSAKLGELMSLLRDSFLWSQSPATLSEDKVSRHKLLHLIELQSGDWQLTSSALGYYYPQAEMTTI